MKLRIRYGSITKVITLQNDNCSIGQLKSVIQESLSTDLNLSSSFDFCLSLNGSTSVGSDSNLLSSLGIVSGDLVKILPNQPSTNREQTSSSSNPPALLSTSSNRPRSEGRELSDNPPRRSGALLLQDYTSGQPLPPSLNALYQSEAVKDRSQVLSILLHHLMLESGFVCQTDASQIADVMQSPVVRLEYSHPRTASLIFVLTFSKLGSFLLLNGIVQPCTNSDDQVLSLHVKLDDHVVTFTSKPRDGSQVYKNVGRLARTFKSEISHRALDNMRTELNLHPLHGLLSLFPEILLRVCSYLDASSLCAVSQTCRSLSDIANEDLLWQPLYLRSFSSAPIHSNLSWKEMYKREYLRRQREERERREYERDFTTAPSPFFVPNPDVPLVMPYPGQPLGMLGGDQDLDPTFPYGPFAGRPGSRQPPPLPIAPRRPRLPGLNPLPGSRFDPMYPYGGGNFRPGRGGGMMDDESAFGTLPQRPRRRGNFGADGFGGGFM